MIFYWTLFCFVSLLWCLNSFRCIGVINVNGVFSPILSFILVIILSLFVSIFSATGSVDYENYVDLLNEDFPTSLADFMVLKDPVFHLIGFLLKRPDGSLATLLFLITFFSMWIKFKIFSNIYFKDLFAFALILLFGRFFLLHEFTQWRIALGIALISASVLPALEKKPVQVLVLMLLAALTHLSSIVLFPVVLFAYETGARLKVFILGALFVLALALGYVFDIQNFSRIAPYFSGEYQVIENTLVSFYFIFKIVVVATLLSHWNVLNAGLRCSLIATAYGMLLTLIFVQNDVLSLRFGELTAIFDCICFAYFFKIALRLDCLSAALGTIIMAGYFYYSSTNVVKPLMAVF